MRCIQLVNLALISSLLSSCGGGGVEVPTDPQVRDYSSEFSPLPDSVQYPAENAYSLAKEKLGELLFWDPILSGDQNVSCASCHHPDHGWADARRFSIGSDGIGLGPTRQGSLQTPIHSPTIMNVAFTGLTTSSASDFVSGPYFWDLRANTLEQQALGPIKNPVEMLGYNVSEAQALTEIVSRLNAIEEYKRLFVQAFPESPVIDSDNLSKALATFQRKITSADTRFDRFLNGEIDALSQQEIVGLNKFIDGGCSRCHSGPMLSDNEIHQGEIVVGNQAVRTPNLRNLRFTAPYMHDGSSVTLRQAIAVYENREDLEVNIGDEDFDDIEAFLNSINTDSFYRGKPLIVPSGLPVGGNIN